ncbi:MAG: YHS domain-containing protein [Candidatus Omnitrophota bacterium]
MSHEYAGKIYNFCCVSCIDEFKKDPKKYIKIAEDEIKTVNPAY